MWAIVYAFFFISHLISLGDLYFLNKVDTLYSFDAAANALGEVEKFVYSILDPYCLVLV